MIESIKSIIENLPDVDLVDARIPEAIKNNNAINLNFICTHNARRSHLSQVWAQVMASYYGFDEVTCFSGGTEVTQMHPNVAKTLGRQGFNIEVVQEGDNPKYTLQYDEELEPILAFSKLYNDAFNENPFAAILVCSAAEEACPFIEEATHRILLPFDDPKYSDDTPQEAEVYEAKSLEIAAQMKAIFKAALEN